MLGLFKKQTEVEKLQTKYERLLKDWHRLSTTDRSASDRKFAEAQEVLKQIEAIQAKG